MSLLRSSDNFTSNWHEHPTRDGEVEEHFSIFFLCVVKGLSCSQAKLYRPYRACNGVAMGMRELLIFSETTRRHGEK